MTESLRLLLVDDDEVDRMAVRRALRAAGVEGEVIEAPDAEEGLRACRAGAFDCVILDYNLPGQDGMAVLATLRREGVDTPIVVLTGHGDPEVAAQLIQCGASDYLSKDSLSPERLSRSIRYALRVRAAELQSRAAEEALRTHALRLRELTHAALAITSAGSLGDMLEVITRYARTILAAAHAQTVLAVDGDRDRSASAVSLSESYERFRDRLPRPAESQLVARVCDTNRALRLGAEELAGLVAHPGAPAAEGALDEEGQDPPPLRCWLAAPLVARDGGNLGLIHVSDREDGAFTEEDEAILVQLAQLASVAIENTRLYEQTQRAVRSREDVLAVVSHDLRNPLNTIAMGSALLLETELPPDRRRKQTEAIQRAAERMKRLIQDLLDVARLESGQLSMHLHSQSLASILQEGCDLLSPLAADKAVTLHWSAEEGLPPVLADRDRLVQVLSNLVGNAIKFTPRGGSVTVRASAEEGETRVAVSDTGPGIDEEDLPRVFAPFWQARRTAAQGAGLGLAIARGIVEAHGGRIWVESRAGSGATFLFSLPAAAPVVTQVTVTQ